MPIVAVSQPYCCAMGRMAILMFTLSMLHSMKAIKHRPMIVQRLFHLLALPATCMIRKCMTRRMAHASG